MLPLVIRPNCHNYDASDGWYSYVCTNVTSKNIILNSKEVGPQQKVRKGNFKEYINYCLFL